MKNKQLIIGIILAVMSLVCIAVALYGPIKNKIDKENLTTTAEYTGENSSEIYTGEDESYAEFVPQPSTDRAQYAAQEAKQLSDYRAVTTDVYAMLRIPGTKIDYPVAQHAEKDNFYLRHDIHGKFSANGTLFTEGTYNSKSFDDRVTVIYGHNMASGEMFGNLQEIYSDEETFNTYKDIYINTNGKDLHYKVFAAVPYDNTHILYHYGRFQNPDRVDEFLKSIYNTRDFSVNISEDDKPESGDRILVLSTCLKGNYSKRFLVLAKFTEKT